MQIYKMTVSELIRQLQKMPQHALVVTEGYETGMEPVKKVELVNAKENQSQEWWDGKFSKTDKLDDMQVVFLNAETKAGW